MRIAFLTLGCKLNYAETSTYERGFTANGLEVVPWEEQADVYLINTCSVTERAEKKCRNVIRKMHRTSPGARIIVTGCYAELRRNDLLAIDGVSLVFGAKEKSRVVPDTMELILNSGSDGTASPSALRAPSRPACGGPSVHEATGGHGLTEPQSADAARKPGAVGAVAEPVVRQNSPTIEAASDRPIESAVTSTSSVTETADSATGNDVSVENVGSQVIAEENPAPRTRRKPVKTGVSLSLNSMIEEEENKKVVNEAAPVADVIPDDDAVLEAWKTIPAENASSPRLANTLQNAEVGIETKDGYKMLTFKVSNAAQEKWIRENRLMVLEGNLRKKVGSSRIRLEVGVLPIEDKGVQPYTDQEKATVLMGQNGEVQNLVKDFGLETR